MSSVGWDIFASELTIHDILNHLLLLCIESLILFELPLDLEVPLHPSLVCLLGNHGWLGGVMRALSGVEVTHAGSHIRLHDILTLLAEDGRVFPHSIDLILVTLLTALTCIRVDKDALAGWLIPQKLVSIKLVHTSVDT